MMNLELTAKQYRRLLDMVYIGNWVLNSTRGEDRFRDYDEVESLMAAPITAPRVTGTILLLTETGAIPTMAPRATGITRRR